MAFIIQALSSSRFVLYATTSTSKERKSAMDHTRKIEQITAINQKVADTKEHQLVVIARCNDNSVLMTRPDDARPYWSQLPDIPQPAKGDPQ
jgi:hypothetical protein